MDRIYNILYACIACGLMYGIYCPNIHILGYSGLCGIVGVSLLRIFSKESPIKRRYSDYTEEELEESEDAQDSNA